jgi:hypothetical protein
LVPDDRLFAKYILAQQNLNNGGRRDHSVHIYATDGAGSDTQIQIAQASIESK